MSIVSGEDPPKQKFKHLLGEDLVQLSVEELGERIDLLKAEISRLEDAKASKQAGRSKADQFFKV